MTTSQGNIEASLNEMRMKLCLRDFKTTNLDELTAMLNHDRLILEDLSAMEPAYSHFHKSCHSLIGHITALVSIQNGNYSPFCCVDVMNNTSFSASSVEMRREIKNIAKEFNCTLYETIGVSCSRYILHPSAPSKENIKDIREMIGVMFPSLYGIPNTSVIQAWPTKIEVK